MDETRARTSTMLMSEPEVLVVPVDDSTAAMLAATALGLAIASRDDGASTLRVLADGDAAALAAARTRLGSFDDVERSAIADARSLLTSAATEVGLRR